MESRSSRLWGPPGVLFFAGSGLAIAAAFEADSRASFGMTVTALELWVVVGAIWLGRFLGAARMRRLRLSPGEWFRWLAIPVLCGLSVIVLRTDWPFEVRLSLSRAGMNQAAAEVMAGGTKDRGWIGLYPVEHVERIPNGMRFLVTGSGFINSAGFAYSPAGPPMKVDGDDVYEPLGGGWWTWLDMF